MQTKEQSQVEQSIHIWTNEINNDQKQLLSVLQQIQNDYHDISDEAIRIVADDFHIQPAEIFGLASLFTRLAPQPKGKYKVMICDGLACDSQSKGKPLTYLQNKLGINPGETSLDGLFSLELTQCMGLCDQGPIVKINNQIFTKVTPQIIDTIIEQCQKNQEPPLSLPKSSVSAIWEGKSEISSFLPIVPGSVIHMLKSLSPEKLLNELSRNQILPEKEIDRLRHSEDEPYIRHTIVCNTDFAQSGSFKERILLADYFDLFIEGLIACAFISGSNEGIIYLRPEFDSLQAVLASYLENLNLLTSSTPEEHENDKLSYSISVRTSPGFIAGGTETILRKAINSDRLVSDCQSPSSISVIQLDVESVIKVGNYIVNNKQNDQTHSETTHIWAISGDCALPGVYELPGQTTINEILQLTNAKDVVAVQIGGVFGKFFIPAQFDIPLLEEDYFLRTNILIYNSKTNFQEIAVKLLKFASHESCGQCVPCRNGSLKLIEYFQKIKNRRRYSVLELNSIIECMQSASKCEFGQNAANSFQSLIHCFPELL